MLYKVNLDTYWLEKIEISDIEIEYRTILSEDGYVYIDHTKDEKNIYIDIEFNFSYHYRPNSYIINIKNNVLRTIRNTTIEDILL